MDKHMFVYRVEVNNERDEMHSNVGGGVYSAQLPEDAPKTMLSRILAAGSFVGIVDVQPMPYSDEGLALHINEYKWQANHNAIRFAFISINAYRRWFHNPLGREAAAQWGRLTKYRVPVSDVLVGSTQCLVVARSMEEVGHYALDTQEVST